MNITPLKRKVLRAMASRTLTFRDLAAKHWELCPTEYDSAPQALFRAGDLDRIDAVMDDTSLKQEMARIYGGKKVHAATAAYMLTDVEFLDGVLYKGCTSHKLTNGKERLFGPTTTDTVANAALACTLYGNIYFGHWMADDISLHPAAAQLGEPVVVERKLYHHEKGYRELFDFKMREVARVKCEQITVIDDFGQNSFKRARYELIRSHLAATATSANNERVVIGRGTLGSPRPLVNTIEVHEYLRSQGFIVLDPEKLTAAEIAVQTLGARVVIGVEGSHMSHALYTMAADGVFCFIQPPGRFNNIFKDYTDCLGMKYAFAVGKPVERGFEFPLDDLKHFLDLAGA